jgi:hypothetical protein
MLVTTSPASGPVQRVPAGHPLMREDWSADEAARPGRAAEPWVFARRNRNSLAGDLGGLDQFRMSVC